MASTGKKGKKNKGKTVPLNDFLSNNTNSWIDQVDEADKLGEFTRKPALPAAPRAARALELDESRIPKNPPYVAYLSNLSYELEEADIIDSFAELSILTVRLPRDDRSGRLKGFGYVEFKDRGSFISALQKHEATIRGRRIKIDVAENEGERRRGGPRDGRDRDSNYDPERTLGDWRSGPRSEFASNDDRRGPMSGRKEYGGFRDRDGFDRNRRDGAGSGGDRESSWRNNERRPFGSDRDRDRDGRSSFGSRRGFNDSEGGSEPRTRTKLNLKPRTLPVEEVVVQEEPIKKEEEQPEPEKPSAASIFGKAKPVDTAAREREIEQRLEKEREGGKNDKDLDISKPRDSESSSTDLKGTKPASYPKENVWVRKSLRTEAQNVTSRSPSGKTDDLDEPPPANDSDKEIPENSEDSSRYSESKGNDDYYEDRDPDRDGDRGVDRDAYRDEDRDAYRDDDRDADRDFDRDGDRDVDRDGDRDRDRDRDGDRRFSRQSNNDNRSDRVRDGDRSYRRDDRWRDDKDRRRDYERRDRGYDSDRRGGNGGGRNRDPERDGDSRRFSEKDGDSRRYSDKEDHRRFSNDREGDKRFQEREGGRYRDQDDHGNSKGSRGDRRPGPPVADKGPRQVKGTQERERGPQNKDKPREPKKFEDGLRMPKLKEAATPNYIGTNKYSFLEDGTSE